ncbi:MAG: hypothetical protein AB1439_09075 [candidate division FCPU426 bacterium]
MNHWLKGMLLACLALGWAATALADSFQAMALQQAQLYGDRVSAPAEVRDQYLSQGQEYLRRFLRSQMRELISSSGMSIVEDSRQASVAMDIDRMAALIGLPLEGQVRIYADEDLNRYLSCGRFLPIEIEVDSSYPLVQQVTMNTKVEAPFDDVMRVWVGPELKLKNGAHSYLEYHLQMDGERSNGLAFGIGFRTQGWRWRLNYEVTSSLVHLQHFSLAKDF